MLCYILCGMPGSGKSYWRKSFCEQVSNAYIISTDDYVEKYAAQIGIPYSDAWAYVKDTLDNIILQQVAEVKDKKPSIVIWDQTNLTMTKRDRIRKLLGTDYTYIVVDFTDVPMNDILEVNTLRKDRGRELPDNVLMHFKSLCEKNIFLSHEVVLPSGRVSEVINLETGEEIHD